MFLYCYRCNAIFCGVNLVYLYLFNTCFPLILRDKIVNVILYAYYSKTQVVFIFFCEILLKICYCSHTTVPRGVLAWICQNPETYKPSFISFASSQFCISSSWKKIIGYLQKFFFAEIYFFQLVKKLYNSRYSFSVSSKARTV